MSHHLTPHQREDVHQAHVLRDGGTAARPVQLEVRDQQTLIANVSFEVCLACGFASGVGCDHGAMFWTHRPGCPQFNPQVFGFTSEDQMPVGLYKRYEELWPEGSLEVATVDCGGCLLVCPLCRADGT